MEELFFGFEKIEEIEARNMSPVSLAFVGDGVHTLFVRTMVARSSTAKAGLLHKEASKHVKAESQAKCKDKLDGFLTENEEYIFKRGRNAKTANTAKNASMMEYKIATGLEALLGYLYLTGQKSRLVEVLQKMEE